jgi:phosphoribosylanthranilate isomerase
MTVLVKICGINSIEAADAAVMAKADFIGLNFHRASPRYLETEPARLLGGRVRSRLKLVALVCDEPDDRIHEIVVATRPDFLQLHGAEDPSRAAHIRHRFGTPVIKVFGVSGPGDVVRVQDYQDIADMFLFDAAAPLAASRPGGHGISFDWRILRTQTFKRPWLLAGGLTAENVGRAIAASGAAAVDVSSGVESSPGRKEPAMIQAFIASAQTANLAEEKSA